METEKGRVRVNYSHEVDLYLAEGSSERAICRNISFNGMFLETKKLAEPGESCRIEFLVNDVKPPRTLVIETTVARKAKDGLGLRFVKMTHETFDHLKVILYFNSKNPKDLVQEQLQRPGYS